MDPSFRSGDSPRRRKRNRAAEWRLSDGEDLERALHAAEQLLQQAEERRRHEQNRTFAIISIIVGTVLSLLASLIVTVQFFSNISGLIALITVLVASAIILASIRSLLMQRQRASFDHTLRLATQLSGMVNETLVDVAERENWSYLRIKSTKLRLSAFPLMDPPHDSSKR